MNRVVYELLGLRSRKNLFMFVYLVNESSSSLNLDSTIKQVELKHNFVFMNKLLSMRVYMRHDLSILYLYVYMYSNFINLKLD